VGRTVRTGARLQRSRDASATFLRVCESHAAIPEHVRASLTALGIDVPEAMLQSLGGYLDALLEANRRVNLTGVRDRDQAWRRHVVDSLTLLPLLGQIPEGARLVDVGSGGGLPGVPLAITRPDLHVTLVESTGKKARFLESLQLPNTTVINDRAEHLAHQPDRRQQYDVAVCRAIGRMPHVLEWVLPLVRAGGELLAMKGPTVEKELRECDDAWLELGAGDVRVVEAYPPEFEHGAVVVAVEKARPTPARYPRPANIMQRSPL